MTNAKCVHGNNANCPDCASTPMSPEDHLHSRIEGQRREIERLKKALDCWHDEYCGCDEGIANHRDLKLARVDSSDEPEKQA